MKTMLVVLTTIVAVCSLSPPASSQATEASSRCAPQVEIAAVVTVADIAFVELGNGSVMVMSSRMVDEVFSDSSPPPPAVHITWTSGGTTVTVDVYQRPGEADSKFAARAAAEVKEMKGVFPPDPPKEK